MKKATAHDFVEEALAGNGIQYEGNVSSDQTNSHSGAGVGAGDTAGGPSVGFTMDPKSGLTVEIVKRNKTERKWIAAPFEIIGRVRDPIVYSLASGIGKQRARQDGSPRRPKSWRVIILSTGELSIPDKIREAGKLSRAGQEIRILDVDADAGRGFGVFDHGGPNGDSEKVAIAIKEAATKYYGTAGPAFVKALSAAGLDTIAEDIKATHVALTERITRGARNANGQVRRAAQRFALTGAAGELAILLGILPWPAGDVASATEEIFASWLGDRGDDPGEIRGACEQIRKLLERFGDSRFDPQIRNDDARPVLDRLGWVRGSGRDRQWLIAPATWRDIFCQGFDPKTVARAFADRGFLLADGEGKFSRAERIDGKSTRVYVLTAALLTDDTPEAAK